MAVGNHNIGKAVRLRNGAFDDRVEPIGVAALLIARFEEGARIVFASRAVRGKDEAETNALVRVVAGLLSEVGVHARAAADNPGVVKDLQRLGEPFDPIVDDVVVAERGNIGPGIDRSGDILRPCAEDHALGWVWFTAIGEGHLGVDHGDVGRVAENIEGRLEEVLDAVGLDQSARLLIAPARKDVPDKIDAVDAARDARFDAHLTGVASEEPG